MGFSVTMANVIFFVAALTAGSAAMDVFWHASSATSEARVEWNRAATNEVLTDLTLTVTHCADDCNAPSASLVWIDVLNAGRTVVDHTQLTFIIDGRAHGVGNFTAHAIVAPVGLSNTDLILPGETMRIELQDVPLGGDYDADDDATNEDDLPVIVVTLDGAIGGR